MKSASRRSFISNLIKPRITLILLLTFTIACVGIVSRDTKKPVKVYVMMGFHTSFYHSWRGDSNDEAGFGTDIRIVRGILDILKKADAAGLDARGYWDIDGYFTLETIIAENAPDITAGIKKRVEADLDEVLPAPYNNGLISAHTPYELINAIKWTMENPWGTGLRQVFGKCTPIFRSQESVTTTGMIPIFEKAGIKALILPYSPSPFTSIAAFVPPLEPRERYGTFWLRHPTGPERIAVIPAYNPSDALDYGSFELWLRKLRKMQTSGKVDTDLLLHYNFDADAESWLPMEIPYGLSGLPNTRGLIEIIEAVNKYPWAEFITPAEYLADHPPQKEVLVRRDTADGSFDGYYSWAEKHRSHEVWTAVEKSRMYTYRADYLNAPPEMDKSIDEQLWADRGSSYWYRLLAMSTTHFGMSTPTINEERQAKAYQISDKARDMAYGAYLKSINNLEKEESKAAPYLVTVFNYTRAKDGPGTPARGVARVPVVLDAPARPVVSDLNGNRIKASLIDTRPLGGDSVAGEVVFVADMKADESRTFEISFEDADVETTAPSDTLDNGTVRLILSEKTGVKEFAYNGVGYGAANFLEPFISYKTKKKPVVYGASKWEISVPPAEIIGDGVQRSRLAATVPIQTPEGDYTATFTYTFTLFDELPYLIVDVTADYPYTPPRDLIQTIQQKLRRLLDLRWHEVGPFQISPDIRAPESDPISIWKHNYLDVTSHYDLDYGKINTKNRELDSFNHQITNGWVAMENGTKGLLIAQDAEVNSLFAFMPMRLRVDGGGQRLFLNPFGTYFGRQFDYGHMGTNQTGRALTIALGAHLRPSGCSWNGVLEKFRIMLAPYGGGEPPVAVRDDAMAFFYPFGVVYHQNPMGTEVVTAEDARSYIDDKLRQLAMQDESPLPTPGGLLANPADQAIDLVWDEPRDIRVTGYQVQWKRAENSQWTAIDVDSGSRLRVVDLTDGSKYLFRVRSMSGERSGDWTEPVEGIPGAVEGVDFSHESRSVPLSLARRLLFGIVKHKVIIH